MSQESLRETAVILDREDPLRSFRDRFFLPEGQIYLDGNSLGPLSREALAAVEGVLSEWRDLAIGGWMGGKVPWFHLSEELGEMLAPLVGAQTDEVVVTGSTTVNLHQLLQTFYDPKEGRDKILADDLSFPSDRYALWSHVRLRGLDPREAIRFVPPQEDGLFTEEEFIQAMTGDVALVLLPSVLYRSGQLLDMGKITQAARDKGITIGWDLCHSAGVLPHDLHGWGPDFAFFCTYKYLNGGPGSTAALFVPKRHHGRPPGMWGWFGSDKKLQFDMTQEFHPAPGVGAFQIGTPHILSSAPLLGSLGVTREAGMDRIRQKSLQLTAFLMAGADEVLAPHAFSIATPREETRRGGHVALRHPDAPRITRALKDRGVIPDFRPPDIIRLGPNPLFTTFSEILEAVLILEKIMTEGAHKAYPAEREEVG